MNYLGLLVGIASGIYVQMHLIPRYLNLHIER